MFLLDLVCVNCNNKEALQKEEFTDFLICSLCNAKYPIIENIPVVINEKESIFSFKDFIHKKSLFFELENPNSWKKKMLALIPTNATNWPGRKNFKLIANLLSRKSNPRVLVIGGSIIGNGMEDFLQSKDVRFVESDVSFGPRTKLIMDSHHIPFPEGSFDAVVIQAVLEHVVNPQLCVKEIHRVLKPEGFIYAETPFMQQVHGGPFDFTRFTHSGHRLLFKNFSEIESGLTAGAGTAFLWALEYLMVALFAFNNSSKKIIKLVVRLLGFWIKYLDFLSLNNKFQKDAASGYYFIGQKSDSIFPASEIISYYTGTIKK